MNMEIQINENLIFGIDNEMLTPITIRQSGYYPPYLLTYEEMDAIVEAYLKEKYPDYWKHIKYRIDTAKEYQRVVTAIYATENPKTSENV